MLDVILLGTLVHRMAWVVSGISRGRHLSASTQKGGTRDVVTWFRKWCSYEWL